MRQQLFLGHIRMRSINIVTVNAKRYLLLYRTKRELGTIAQRISSAVCRYRYCSKDQPQGKDGDISGSAREGHRAT